jgi:hypothetical protein
MRPTMSLDPLSPIRHSYRPTGLLALDPLSPEHMYEERHETKTDAVTGGAPAEALEDASVGG